MVITQNYLQGNNYLKNIVNNKEKGDFTLLSPFIFLPQLHMGRDVYIAKKIR